MSPLRRLRLLPVTLAIVLFASTLHAGDAQLRAGMQSILATLTVILPLSLTPDSMSSAANRAEMKSALDWLAESAETIRAHANESIPTHQVAGNALATSVGLIRQDFEAGRYEHMRAGILLMTRACFACHSKLPAGRDTAMGGQLLETPQVRALPLSQRAVLAVATRRFDQALSYYEALFRSDELEVDGFAWMGALEDYLKVALRVRQDTERPVSTLRALAGRGDLAPHLVRYLNRWVAALRDVDMSAVSGQELVRARELLARADRVGAYPADPTNKVHHIAVSSLMHRYLALDGQDRESRSEAWYLLGVAESHMTSTYWLGETEIFLANAIRAAPGTPAARRAYTFLENYLIVEFSGSGGLHLPPEVAARLERLHAIAEGTPRSSRGG